MTLIDVERPRVLIVDDEKQVTQSLKLVLRKEYDISAASSGEEALALLETGATFDILVSDMRMPGMSGAEFLRHSREILPHAVRIALTGQADAATTAAAVNDGQIFRFLGKPCSPAVLRAALADALTHRALHAAERDVLARTLRGLGLVLSEVLGTVHPIAAHRSERMRSAVRNLAPKLGIVDTWRVELAAALSHLGCVALKSSTVATALRKGELDETQAEAWAQHPVCGAELIENVPRLEGVADMIRRHGSRAPEFAAGEPLESWSEEALGGELLRTTLHLFGTLAVEDERNAAIGAMRESGEFHPGIVDILGELPPELRLSNEVDVRAPGLLVGMTLLEDLTSRDGVVLACSGAKVTPTLRKLANNFSQRGELREPIRVSRRPVDDAADAA